MERFGGRRPAGYFFVLLPWGAPAAALAAGSAAEWLDFRTLRYPLLVLVLAGVLATASAIESRGRGTLVRVLIIGVATWAAAEMSYVIIHAARGEAFAAGRFGPQWGQALGLIVVHALVLGAPTGIVAGVLLWIRGRFWRRRLALESGVRS